MQVCCISRSLYVPLSQLINVLQPPYYSLGIPGYPYWMWKINYQQSLPFIKSYRQNSLPSDSDEMRRIRSAARENGIYVSMGYSEIDMATLHLAQVLISPSGDILNHRRKIKPTHVERLIFGDGAGDTFEPVVETEIGRIGQLNCWENLNPFLKAYAASLGEQVSQTPAPLRLILPKVSPEVFLHCPLSSLSALKPPPNEFPRSTSPRGPFIPTNLPSITQTPTPTSATQTPTSSLPRMPSKRELTSSPLSNASPKKAWPKIPLRALKSRHQIGTTATRGFTARTEPSSRNQVKVSSKAWFS